jgi:hypothetical protein
MQSTMLFLAELCDSFYSIERFFVLITSNESKSTDLSVDNLEPIMTLNTTSTTSSTTTSTRTLVLVHALLRSKNKTYKKNWYCTSLVELLHHKNMNLSTQMFLTNRLCNVLQNSGDSSNDNF